MAFSRNAIRSARRNRTIAVFLAVCYGLAASAAGLHHDHDEDNDASASACSCVSDGHSVENPADYPSPHSPRPCPSDGSKCAVCKFLAQKTLPACPLEEVTSAVLVQAVALAAPPQCIAPTASPWHSRAPPDVV